MKVLEKISEGYLQMTSLHTKHIAKVMLVIENAWAEELGRNQDWAEGKWISFS